MFLAANVGFGNLPSTCGWKLDYTPAEWVAQLDGNPGWPVRNIDWCDAWAYCDWAGLRLCGGAGGGPAVFDQPNDPVNNEWFRACSNSGVLIYPYGNLYDPNACNGMDLGLAEPSVPGSLPGCEGGVPNLFDMSGNVSEWTNDCQDDPNQPSQLEQCRRRGGSYFSNQAVLHCALNSTRARNDRSGSTGVRCCANP